MLFSDIEGSTGLLSRLGDRYGEALSAQRSMVRAAFTRHRGTEMGTEGDSFFVVFTAALDAARACVAAQRALAGHDWPLGATLRVRMGLHTGEPTRHEDGYIGMDVHRAARIAASAHGGQAVMSSATRQLVAGRLPGTDLQDLGWHRLKDIAEPEHLYQLLIPGLQAAFPPLKSLGNRGSLPVPPTSLVGRGRDLRHVQDVLSGDPAARLITLTGPGGVGKTRLALAVADSLGHRFRDGVYFVPLAPVTAAAVMWTTIAERLGVPGDSRSPPAFFEHVADRQALLLLDNLEQLPAAAGVVAELMAAAPGITLLATSRRPLRVLGEHEYPVPPLPHSPAPGGRPDGAVELFVQHARMVSPAFALTPGSTSDVAAICDRLDGLPLAIELAAARARLLSPRALLARLGRSLEFEAGTAGRPDRQRTLRDTFTWSYDLLDPALRACFRRMGAFSGGCDLDAVAAVASGDADALDSVAELVDASLASVRDGPDGEARVGMLQTVREFARQLLEQAGELDEVRSAHASYYAGFAETIAPQLQGPRPLAARDRLEAELENMRAALTWCLGPPDSPGGHVPQQRVTLGLRLCRALSWFWYALGYTAEGRGWQRRAVAVASAEQGPDLAAALHGLAVLLLQQGEAAEASEALSTCLAIWRRLGNRSKVAVELSSLGVAHWTLGDLDAARRMLRESADIAREVGDDARQSTALSNLGILEVGVGNAAEAIDLLEQALVLDEKVGNAWGCATTQANLAGAMLRAGRTDDAYASLRSRAADIVGLGDVELTISVIELFAIIFAQRADAGRAARLAGTAGALRERAGMPICGPDAEFLEEYLGKARDSVTAAVWGAQRRTGQAYTAEQALAEAGAES
jgi:predicted ATPase/class 3 adenylate cyclase